MVAARWITTAAGIPAYSVPAHLSHFVCSQTQTFFVKNGYRPWLRISPSKRHSARPQHPGKGNVGKTDAVD